jgi:uncharacterized SAM-binding protein YcdF (DUF218 family)
MFALKKLISASLQPFSVLVGTLVLGLILLRFTKRHRTGKALLLAALAGCYLFSITPVANAFVRPLESAYPPLLPHASTPLAAFEDGSAAPGWIVVLGGGNVEVPSRAPLQQLVPGSVARLTEAIRLHRLFPEAKLLLSGGTVHSRLLADAAQSLGVPRERMVLAPDVLDTEDEAKALHLIVGQEPMVLVTSAMHMPRAVALFREVGAIPVAAPTDYAGDTGSWSARNLLGLFPHAGAGAEIEHALHEYLGLLWAKLRGQI